jgi:hypothetical protein
MPNRSAIETLDRLARHVRDLRLRSHVRPQPHFAHWLTLVPRNNGAGSCSPWAARTPGPNWPCEKPFTDAASDFVFIKGGFRERPISFFRDGAWSFSCTAASGTGMTVPKVGFRRVGLTIGGRRSAPPNRATPTWKIDWRGWAGGSSRFGNARSRTSKLLRGKWPPGYGTAEKRSNDDRSLLSSRRAGT